MNALRSAALVYAAGLAIHSADHVRRGADVLAPRLQVGGAITTAIAVVSIALVLMRHRLGPIVAAVTAPVITVLVLRTHVLPGGDDPFAGSSAVGVTALSWFAVVLELAGAIAFGIAAIAVLSARRRPT